MDRKVLFVCLCVAVFSSMISSSQGGFCSRIHNHYHFQRYCAHYSWLNRCWHYYYRQITVPHVVMDCCPGFNGTDCTTPICTTPCEPGYICTSPDECTPDTITIGTTNTPISISTAVNESTDATTGPNDSNRPTTEPSESTYSSTKPSQSTYSSIEPSQSTYSSTEQIEIVS